MGYLYTGERLSGDGKKMVFRDGFPIRYAASRNVVDYAMEGEWGIIDTPQRRQLALAMLLETAGTEVAKDHHERFALDVLSVLREWPYESSEEVCWWMATQTIRDWLAGIASPARRRRRRQGRES